MTLNSREQKISKDPKQISLCLLEWWQLSTSANKFHAVSGVLEWEELSMLISKSHKYFIVQFSSVAQLCLTLCDPMNRSMLGLPVHHQLPEFTQTHVHQVGDAIQPPHPLSSPSPPALNLSQHQGLFKWVSSLHEVAKVLVFQLQHLFFQRIPRTDLL